MNEMTIREAGKVANLRVWNQRVAADSIYPQFRNHCYFRPVNIAIGTRNRSSVKKTCFLITST